MTLKRGMTHRIGKINMKIWIGTKEQLEAQEKVIRQRGMEVMSGVFGYTLAKDENGEVIGVVGKRNGKDDWSSITTLYDTVKVDDANVWHLLHIEDPSLNYSDEYIQSIIDDGLINPELIEATDADLTWNT